MSEELVHYGVKGMKWGVRKDDEVADRSHFQPVQGGPKMDPKVHPESQKAAREVAALIQERYGYTVREVKSIGPGDEDYDSGALAYVQNTGNSKMEGDIHVSIDDPIKPMRDSEKAGWIAKGCGNPTAFITHEAAHAIFHSRERLVNGKVVGGEKDARMKALKVFADESARARIPDHKVLKSISGYAAAMGNHEEIEAELFSQYHWSPKPSKAVRAWGETLHKELGIDPTPFRERR